MLNLARNTVLGGGLSAALILGWALSPAVGGVRLSDVQTLTVYFEVTGDNPLNLTPTSPSAAPASALISDGGVFTAGEVNALIFAAAPLNDAADDIGLQPSQLNLIVRDEGVGEAYAISLGNCESVGMVSVDQHIYSDAIRCDENIFGIGVAQNNTLTIFENGEAGYSLPLAAGHYLINGEAHLVGEPL